MFDFFAQPKNLEQIPPPSLRFSIVTPVPVDMRSGTLIQYRMKLKGIPFMWTTEVTEWNPPLALVDPKNDASFTDVQLKGPYHTWIHQHLFTEIVDKHTGTSFATHMVDEVQYRLPLWPLGAFALPLVRRELRRIFVHRMRVLNDAFA